MKKVKRISKYFMNVLAMINTLIIGLNAIDGITIPYYVQIIEIIGLIDGVVGTYLVAGKLFDLKNDI